MRIGVDVERMQKRCGILPRRHCARRLPRHVCRGDGFSKWNRAGARDL